jgi:hypothetical protein
VFTFDETLSERGARDAVLVSPETGRALLERDGLELKVSLEGGWKPNTVYRVIILPGIQDRFNNARREPTELVFSTGAPLVTTAIGGLVTDRVTGRPLVETRVTAVALSDSVVHATVTDTAGFFGLRFLPVARYNITAFEDQNRNKKLDKGERRAERSINLGSVRDTQVVELAVLAPDTLPARLLRAEPRDSMEVRLVFDDYLDPDQQLTAIRVQLLQMPDSTPVPGATLQTQQAADAARARRDSVARAARDTATADSAARRRPPAPAPGVPLGRPIAPGAARPIIPQELVLVPAQPLQPRVQYRVEIRGVRNINGLLDGGGSANFQLRAPTPPDTTKAPVRRDTIQTHSRRP